MMMNKDGNDQLGIKNMIAKIRIAINERNHPGNGVSINVGRTLNHLREAAALDRMSK